MPKHVVIASAEIPTHTVTGVSPAELLIRRKLRDKLPKVEFSGEQVTEAYRQQKLREREMLVLNYDKRSKQRGHAELNAVALEEGTKCY